MTASRQDLFRKCLIPSRESAIGVKKRGRLQTGAPNLWKIESTCLFVRDQLARVLWIVLGLLQLSTQREADYMFDEDRMTGCRGPMFVRLPELERVVLRRPHLVATEALRAIEAREASEYLRVRPNNSRGRP